MCAFARRLALCVSVFYCVQYRVCVCKYLIISFLECGLHCSTTTNSSGRSAPVRCLQHLSNDWIDSALNFMFESRVYMSVRRMYILCIIYTYVYLVYDFAVLFSSFCSFVRSFIHWKCVNVITTLLFKTQTIGSEVTMIFEE